MNKILLEFLSKTLNLDENGVAALFEADGTPKADSLDKFLELDKTRIAAIRTGKFDEGYNKAKKEVMSKFEADAKAKFGIESDKVGLDLFEEIVTVKTPAGDKLTDEQVKKSKPYLDLQESIDKQKADAAKIEKDKFEAYKQEIEKGKSLSTVKQKAEALFLELKPVLSSDPAKAARQKELFLKQFEAGNYRIEEDRIIMLNADGTDATDDHEKRVDFGAYVKKAAAELFDFQATDPKESPGGKKPAGGAGGAGGKKYSFKDAKDFEDQFVKLTDSKEKISMAEQWQQQNKQQ